MRNVPSIDATGLQVLESLLARTRKENGTLLLTGVQPQPREAMLRSGFGELIGQENILDNIDAGLKRARQIMGLLPDQQSATTDTDQPSV